MPKASKRKALQESSEGEDFGNQDFSDSSSDGTDSEPETLLLPEVPYVPIAVVKHTREAFEQVNDSLLKMNFFIYLFRGIY